MQVVIELPDELAVECAPTNGADLRRAVLEAFALEGYRSGKFTHAQVGRLLGMEYRFDVDAFLKDHGVSPEYTASDLESDVESLRRVRA